MKKVFIAVALLFVVVCIGGMAVLNSKADVTVIPVRIHMLESEDKSVQTTLTDTQIKDIFKNSFGVNEHYWKQAGIQFEIESIVKATPAQVSNYGAGMPNTYADVIANKDVTNASYRKAIGLLAPTSGLLENGFNVVVVHDFGMMGGGFYLPTIAYVPEQSIKGNSITTVTFAFAHELGHALGLRHYNPNLDPYNLMAVGDPSKYDPKNKTNLTSDQITTAKAIAKKGKPNSTD